MASGCTRDHAPDESGRKSGFGQNGPAAHIIWTCQRPCRPMGERFSRAEAIGANRSACCVGAMACLHHTAPTWILKQPEYSSTQMKKR